uniref:PH domain-containing protein n=1 Tax=Pygocentrus nattereri TaxID=42514 RepID=A0AAR2J327_PYGNA
MAANRETPCRKFQANMFNKSKCQNCFKPRDAHLLSDEDFAQAKPIYGGWLLLAPEGTNFDNPLHRSRKWQRRFFLLYEHGLLRYALDDMASTLPQGTINLNVCVDVVDGESATGQKHSLCISTPEKEHYIRAESREVIIGWQEALIVFPRTNKQNQKKKRKVEPPTPQVHTLEHPCRDASRWSFCSVIEVQTRFRRVREFPKPQLTGSLAGDILYSVICTLWLTNISVMKISSTFSNKFKKNIFSFSCVTLYFLVVIQWTLEWKRLRAPVIGNIMSSNLVCLPLTMRLCSAGQDLSLDASTARSVPDVSGTTLASYRRAKSLDRRVTESSMTPDLLNFKKGWMTKLYEDGLWKKHWFVLTDQSLRYYRDSIAEEAADLDGEIDLSTCFDVTEFPVQRNYGFQIHSKEGLFTLSAMTSGIRRNWIQAIMKSVRPTITPDVTRYVSHLSLTHSSPSLTRLVISDSAPPPEQRKNRARDRRREGRSKTFDWAEFHPGQDKGAPSRERAETKLTRQEEEDRRRRFHPSSSLPPSTAIDHGRMEVDSSACVGVATGTQAASQNPDVQVEIEQRWHQVETTPLREEKQVPITGSSAHLSTGDGIPPQELAALLDKELGQTQRELVRLQEQNSLLQEQLQDARGREQSAREGYVLQETCERGFAAMEETHQKVIEDLQRQHQREINKLLEERERLLEEETNATIAAIEAMKNAHREELEKTQRAQLSGVSADIEQLRMQYEEELQSIHRELEVLSEQYSQKCLENAHLAQALEAERQALQQCQRENQQLHAHNQELNNRLTVEITRMRSCLSGEKVVSPLTQGKDLYELEVLLRIKESEIQYLKQEINSLKDELQSALRDKKYASDKYKDIYTELSIVRAKADCDISKLREKLLAATEALGERDTDGGAVTPGYDIMKSKSNPDFLKKERSALSRQVRGVRSKSVSEEVPWDS